MSSFEDQGDAKDWARGVMRRDQAGQKVALIAKSMAQEVLGIAVPKKKASEVLSCAGRRIQK